jgi:ribosome-binding protein aMBF1 (putative translation factor)
VPDCNDTTNGIPYLPQTVQDAPPLSSGYSAGFDSEGSLAVAHSFSGQRLRALRVAAGVSREQLAVLVDRSYGVEVRWEVGTAVPDANDIGRIAHVLGVAVEEFYDEVPAGAVA